MNPWFRLYHELLDDPKVQRLPGDLFKFWVNCLCLACRGDGQLPPLDDIAFGLRMPHSKVEQSIQSLMRRGLVDQVEQGLTPHAWNERQFQSDNVTERVKRFRQRSKTVNETLDVTPPDQNRTDTEQTQNRTEPNTVPLGHFENVRLSQDQLVELQFKFGNDGTQQRIEALSEYIASKGKKYKSHYATILTWERKNGNGNGRHKTKADLNREAGQRLLSRLDSQDRGRDERGDF